MELMRVLHVHSGNLYGGIETFLATLARWRDACPHLEHEFALCFEGRLSNELSRIGVPVHAIGAVRVSRPMTVFHGRHELRNVLTRGAYDVLIFHSAWSHAVFAPVARVAGLPAIVWMHGTTAGKHWTERWAQRTPPQLVICNSRFTANGAAAVYPGVATEIVYCPVELKYASLPGSERASIRREFDTPEDAVVILQVSRMEPLKGHLLHLAALSKLKSISNWMCWFVGGPQRLQEEDYFNQLQQEAVRLGIAERVRFLKERSDVASVLEAADIYCQPNLQPESFGITFVEALNAGLPVVATRMGGVNEIVDETCGILVPAGDVEAIADGLRQLIAEPRLRRRLGDSGPDRARELCDPAARIADLSEILTGVFSLSRQ
jgi:glycosyltransferase involved in cell wall biosynthesis